MSEALGETGRFPDGKLGSSDLGELAMRVVAQKGRVKLEFGKLVSWLAWTPNEAEALAAKLVEYARIARLG